MVQKRPGKQERTRKQKQKREQKRKRRERERQEHNANTLNLQKRAANKNKKLKLKQRKQQAKKIGYKKVYDGYIVELEILGENNEDRSSIVDKRYAKMRCSRARVLNIYSLHDTNKSIQSARSLHDSSFEYHIGKIVEPDYFFPDKEQICAGGIHYFLTREAAIGYYDIWGASMAISLGRYTGTVIRAYDNGSVYERIYFKNGEEYDPMVSYVIIFMIFMLLLVGTILFRNEIFTTIPPIKNWYCGLGLSDPVCHTTMSIIGRKSLI